MEKSKCDESLAMKIRKHNDLSAKLEQAQRIQQNLDKISLIIETRKGHIDSLRSSLTELLSSSDEEIQHELQTIESVGKRFGLSSNVRRSSQTTIRSKESERDQWNKRIKEVNDECSSIHVKIVLAQKQYSDGLDTISKILRSLSSLAPPEMRSFFQSFEISLQKAISSTEKHVSSDELTQLENSLLSIRAGLEPEIRELQNQKKLQETETSQIQRELQTLEWEERLSQQSLQSDISTTENQIAEKNHQIEVFSGLNRLPLVIRKQTQTETPARIGSGGAPKPADGNGNKGVGAAAESERIRVGAAERWEGVGSFAKSHRAERKRD